MKIPSFMGKTKHSFSIASDVFDKLLAGTTTHIEYATGTTIAINDDVTIRPYGANNQVGDIPLMHCTIKSIDELPVKSGNPFNKLIGLNVQLIMF